MYALGDAPSNATLAFQGLTDLTDWAAALGIPLPAAYDTWNDFQADVLGPLNGQGFVPYATVGTLPGVASLGPIYPQAVAFVILDNALAQFGSGYGPYEVTYTNVGGVLASAAPAGLPAAVSAAIAGLAPALGALFTTVYTPPPPPAGSVSPSVVLHNAWTDAIAAGPTFTIPDYAPGEGLLWPTATGNVIPKSAIIEGPVTLQDGMMYVVFVGDPSVGGDGQVAWWQGPSFVQARLLSSVAPGACEAMPGTGMWYVQGVAGATCPAPPPGVGIDGSLISAHALASINPDDTMYSASFFRGTFDPVTGAVSQGIPKQPVSTVPAPIEGSAPATPVILGRQAPPTDLPGTTDSGVTVDGDGQPIAQESTSAGDGDGTPSPVIVSTLPPPAPSVSYTPPAPVTTPAPVNLGVLVAGAFVLGGVLLGLAAGKPRQ